MTVRETDAIKFTLAFNALSLLCTDYICPLVKESYVRGLFVK